MDRLTQIRNYFDGKLSKAEAEEFLKWYLSEKSDEEVHAEFDKMWHGKAKPEFEYDGKQLFQQILKDKDNTRSLNVLREPSKRNLGLSETTAAFFWLGGKLCI